MPPAPRYRQGQRWTFKSPAAEFESTLVIGGVSEAHPEWGERERTYTVYVRYSDAAKASIPADYDGAILSLTDKGLDRSVTKMVADGVKLPWWWVYGRRFKRKTDAPNSRGVLSCDRVGAVLRHVFESAKGVAEDTRARAEALRLHRETFGTKTKRPRPSRSVAESWKRIEAWYAEHATPLDGSLAPGATATRVKLFEKAIGSRLPDDFKESVRLHDGGGWWVPWRYGDLLSLDQILDQWKMYSEWQERGDYATGDDWCPRDIEGPIKPVFWNTRRIHVSDNSGDHLTLDLDPPAGGTYGQVIDHSHEVGPKRVVASGWGDFLQNLVADLETGKYVYLAHVGSVELVAEVEKEIE